MTFLRFLWFGCLAFGCLLTSTSSAQETDAVDPRTEWVNLKALIYPGRAAERARQGCVLFTFSLDSNSRPTDIEVIFENPKRVFKKSVMEGMPKVRFVISDEEQSRGSTEQYSGFVIFTLEDKNTRGKVTSPRDLNDACPGYNPDVDFSFHVPGTRIHR